MKWLSWATAMPVFMRWLTGGSSGRVVDELGITHVINATTELENGVDVERVHEVLGEDDEWGEGGDGKGEINPAMAGTSRIFNDDGSVPPGGSMTMNTAQSPKAAPALQTGADLGRSQTPPKGLTTTKGMNTTSFGALRPDGLTGGGLGRSLTPPKTARATAKADPASTTRSLTPPKTGRSAGEATARRLTPPRNITARGGGGGGGGGAAAMNSSFKHLPMAPIGRNKQVETLKALKATSTAAGGGKGKGRSMKGIREALKRTEAEEHAIAQPKGPPKPLRRVSVFQVPLDRQAKVSEPDIRRRFDECFDSVERVRAVNAGLLPKDHQEAESVSATGNNRILIFSDHGRRRAAIVAIAYLIRAWGFSSAKATEILW
jgi:hypothetical protein